MTLSVALRLGRVSNLPTVWSNVLVGTILAGQSDLNRGTLWMLLAISLLYVGGMYLNDAFDRDIDARERPDRPIPSGLVSANTVFAAGFAMLLAGILATAWAVTQNASAVAFNATASAVLLAGAILYYNFHHKANALSPFFMGLCRVLAYITAGYAAVAAPGAALFVLAIVTLSYLIGLTYAAKQEALDRLDRLWPLAFLTAPVLYGVWHATRAPWLALVILVALIVWIAFALFLLHRRNKGDVPRAVVSLIAGISVVDALALAIYGATAAAGLAILCFFLSLALQRWISGT